MRILSDLPRNSKNSILAEPMWAIFGGMIFFYAPLYMRQIGLNEVGMGIINTANLFVSFVCHFIAGPITNRLGRKRTTLIFDVISWTIPMFLWAVAQNFWYFLIAAIINASVRIVYVSWNCLLTEDAEESKRAKIFGIIYIINYATGIFTPITGLLIARYGNVATMRVLYFLGMISMTSMFFIRNALTTETRAGRQIMKQHSEMSLLQSLESYIRTIARIFRNRSVILITLIYIITNFVFSMNFFQVIFLKEFLGFNEKDVSLIPGISAVINVLLYIMVMPGLKKGTEEKTLANALFISAAGALMFILIPGGNLLTMLVATTTLSVGSFLMQTYRDSVFMNKLGEHEKADMFSAVQTLTTLVCIPSGYISGYAYTINPLLPFVINLGLLIAAVLISYLLAYNKKKIIIQQGRSI